MKHTIKEIVKGNDAIMTYVCEGKVYYQILVPNSTFRVDTNDNIIGINEKPFSVYQLEINSLDDEWKATNLLPTFKAITLMRWIRKGAKDGKLNQIM
jgi:hypothetical protein